MTAPRKRPARVRPSDVKITDRIGVEDLVVEEAPLPTTAPELAAAPAPDLTSAGLGVLTIAAVVEPVAGAPTDAFVLISQQYGTPLPTTVDEYVNGALLAVTDPELGQHPDVFTDAARWSIEGITSLGQRVTVSHPTSPAAEHERLEEQYDLRRALDTLLLTLDTRQQIIATAITAAGRNAPTDAPGGYRADLAGVVADWLAHALDQHAQQTAAVTPEPGRVNADGSPLTNAGTLDALSADHRRSVGQ